MPCTGGPSREQEQDERNIKAMLCALVRALEDPWGDYLQETLERVDWKEAGITREWFEGWWKRHKAEDAERRARERRGLGILDL